MPNLFRCHVCERDRPAHSFGMYINGFDTRELHLFCYTCAPTFASLPNKDQVKFLRERVESHYGALQHIYGLLDPTTNELRYVGRSTNPFRRFQQHIQSARRFRERKYLPIVCECYAIKIRAIERDSSKKWIANLLKSGLTPRLQILEIVEPSYRVAERETRWIYESIRKGYDLLNAENYSSTVKELIRMSNQSFMSVPIMTLQKSNFVQIARCGMHEVNRECGWQRASLIEAVFKKNARIRVSEDSDMRSLGLSDLRSV
jgi:hypothetical protein